MHINIQIYNVLSFIVCYSYFCYSILKSNLLKQLHVLSDLMVYLILNNLLKGVQYKHINANF
jgi:hypothetical protein